MSASGFHQQKTRKYARFKRYAPQLLCLGVAVLLVAVLGVRAFIEHENRAIEKDYTSQTSNAGDLVEIGGAMYRHRNNLKTYLFMGVDNAHGEEGPDVVGNCDSIWLLVLDQTQKQWFTLTLDRNTITAVDSFDEDYTYLATTDVQLSLAYSHGDGGELSCENTVKSVSNLLGGEEIHGYASLKMDAIPIVNHLIGGVTVTIEDDFSALDPEMTVGKTLHLSDEQAELFVHTRTGVGEGINQERIRRQKVYVEAATEQLKQVLQQDPNFLQSGQKELEAYSISSLQDIDLSYIANALDSYEQKEISSLEGKTELDELGWEAFYPDEDSLNQCMIELFYQPADSQ